MSGTALEHPLVRDYLHELDAAFAALPPGRAHELREQIAAHLDDALPADAGDQEVAAALQRLGSPGDLAAEAAPPPVPAAAVAPVPGRRRFRLRRPGWRGGVLIAAVAVGAGYGIAVVTAAPIQPGGASAWWYAQDSARAVSTQADGRQQTTVPIRSGQQQGFVITVYNPSDWTQTVLGPAADFTGPGGPDVQIGVAGWNLSIERGGGVFRPLSYALPGSIPPHQTRALRVLWTSTTCLEKGSEQEIDQLSLRVRIGWLTRTEVVQLDQAWALSGPSRGRCT
jgi:hypothetical protein